MAAERTSGPGRLRAVSVPPGQTGTVTQPGFIMQGGADSDDRLREHLDASRIAPHELRLADAHEEE